MAGFFNPVRIKLEESFESELESGTLVWIRQAGPHSGPNVKLFKERFNSNLADGVEEILVLVAVLRGQEHG